MLTTVAAVHNTMRTMRSHDEFTLDVDTETTADAADERRKRTKTTHAARRIPHLLRLDGRLGELPLRARPRLIHTLPHDAAPNPHQE
jgi:hypothetical protein